MPVTRRDPTIEGDDLGDGTAKGLSAAEQDGQVVEPRPEASAGVVERKWITRPGGGNDIHDWVTAIYGSSPCRQQLP